MKKWCNIFGFKLLGFKKIHNLYWNLLSANGANYLQYQINSLRCHLADTNQHSSVTIGTCEIAIKDSIDRNRIDWFDFGLHNPSYQIGDWWISCGIMLPGGTPLRQSRFSPPDSWTVGSIILLTISMAGCVTKWCDPDLTSNIRLDMISKSDMFLTGTCLKELINTDRRPGAEINALSWLNIW